MTTHRAEVYLQVVPEWARWDKSTMVGAKVVGFTQKKPAKPAPGAQVVKLALELDEDLFIPKFPSIKIGLSRQNINAPSVVEQEVVWDGT